MTRMTALRAHRRGGPEAFTVESAPIPVAGADEVLVAVHGAAITFDELTWVETWARVNHTPVIPSHEVSGVVVDIGSGVTTVKIGDEVYGLIRFDRDGAAADYVAVAAAALPLAGLTALQALVEHAHVQAGDKVLVTGGTGGLGGLTVQLAARFGASVTTTIRSDAVELVRNLGARKVIDVRTGKFDDITTPYDVVIDTVGGHTLDMSFRVLRRGGRLVTLSAPAPGGMAEEYGVTAAFFVVTPNRGQLAELAALVDEGLLRVEIGATFPSRRAARHSKAGSTPDGGRGRPSSWCGSRRAQSAQRPPRDTNCAAITLRWISLVPSPTIISGASRKYRSTSYSVEYP
jgi:NADPH:quinone reductase-like Zn-dependent oxidoreductase